MLREEDMFNRIRNGDMDAWNEVIGRYYEDIFRYCCWHTPSRESAEDATQETILKAIRYSDRYIHKGQFRAFLYKIATNTCIDLQKKKENQTVSLEQVEEEVIYVELGYRQLEANLSLKQMVQELPIELREVIILRYGQDLSLREIAKVIELPLRTVQSRINRALKILRTNQKGGQENEKRHI